MLAINVSIPNMTSLDIVEFRLWATSLTWICIQHRWTFTIIYSCV